MAKHGFVSGSGAGSIVFLQGVLARRPSRLHVRVDLTGGDVKGVKVGGAAAVVGEGSMTPP
jgi:predicted PhzF superfamily epimerase YddE/YHI9